MLKILILCFLFTICIGSGDFDLMKNGIVVKPLGKHLSTVIFLHGLAQNGLYWAQQLRPGQSRLMKNTKFLLPTAPKMVVRGRGAVESWFDLRLSDFFKTSNDTNTDEMFRLQSIIASLTQLVEREIRAGIPSEKIIVAGFSQGAALSLNFGYSLKRKLGGIVALSGYGLMRDDLKNNFSIENKDTLGVIWHGHQDMRVPIKMGQSIFNFLKKNERNVLFKGFKGLKHEVDKSRSKLFFQFLRDKLGYVKKKKQHQDL